MNRKLVFKCLEKIQLLWQFQLSKRRILNEKSFDVPHLPGVSFFLLVKGSQRRPVYIGKSGTTNKNGTFKAQLLNRRVNSKHGGIQRQSYLNKQLASSAADFVEIHWIATFDSQLSDIPSMVEIKMIQELFDASNVLPDWNECY